MAVSDDSATVPEGLNPETDLEKRRAALKRQQAALLQGERPPAITSEGTEPRERRRKPNKADWIRALDARAEIYEGFRGDLARRI